MLDDTPQPSPRFPPLPLESHQQPPIAVHAISRHRRVTRPRRTASYPADHQLVSRVGRRQSMYNWLFDRPAHRRAARSIGQNTSNLVRRLSQSRLFLNFAGTQQQPPTQPHQSNALVDTVARETAPYFVNVPDMVDAEAAWQLARTTAPNDSSQPRTETPPPMYQDVVK